MSTQKGSAAQSRRKKRLAMIKILAPDLKVKEFIETEIRELKTVHKPVLARKVCAKFRLKCTKANISRFGRQVEIVQSSMLKDQGSLHTNAGENGVTEPKNSTNSREVTDLYILDCSGTNDISEDKYLGNSGSALTMNKADSSKVYEFQRVEYEATETCSRPLDFIQDSEENSISMDYGNFTRDDLQCGLCLDPFDEDLHAPLFVTCGHTFCRSCIEALGETWRCPNCKTRLGESKKEFPINVVARNLVAQLKNTPCVNCAGKKLRKRIEVCKEALRKVTKINTEYDNQLDFCLAKLCEFEDAMEAPSSSKNFDPKTLKQIEEKMSNIESVIRNPVPKYWLHFSECENLKEYLYKIYNAVLKGEKVFVCHIVSNQVKFGQVTAWSNNLLFHNLSLSVVESEEYLVKFNDVKKCMSSSWFTSGAFLKIQCNGEGLQSIVAIDLKNHSMMPQFVKLCTGELGPSYKHCKFEQGEVLGSNMVPILKVNKYVNGSSREGFPVDYETSKGETIHYPNHSVVVMMFGEGEFRINKIVRTETQRDLPIKGEFPNIVVGTVERPANLDALIDYEHTESFSIEDSGLIFQL